MHDRLNAGSVFFSPRRKLLICSLVCARSVVLGLWTIVCLSKVKSYFNYIRELCYIFDRVFFISYRNPSDKVKGEWRRLHNEELNDLYSSPNIVRVIKSRRMRWVGHVARMGEERGVYRVLVGKLEGKRPLGRPRRRWVDNIRMDLQEVGCGYMNWIELAQDRDRWRRLVSAVMNLGVP